MGGEVLARPGMVVGMVGAEGEQAARFGGPGKAREVLRLEEAVLVLAGFRPGIRVKDEDLVQPQPRRERVEELRGLGLEEGHVGQSAPGTLGLALAQPLAEEVDAHAALRGVRRGVGVQPVAVAAADLQRQPSGFAQLRDDAGARGRHARLALRLRPLATSRCHAGAWGRAGVRRKGMRITPASHLGDLAFPPPHHGQSLPRARERRPAAQRHRCAQARRAAQ